MSEGIELFNWRLQDVQLKHVQLINLMEYNPDTKKMQLPESIGYYRQPSATEYPLNLAEGYESYIHRDWTSHSESPHDRALNYLMEKENPKLLMNHIDFVINRHTMIRIMEIILTVNPTTRIYSKDKEKAFVAVRFKQCIFLHMSTNFDVDFPKKKRGTYAFKARQYLFTDTPGSTPKTDVPVNENRQLYGTFSAKLGKFRLMYSGEVTGVENTKPLGDLNDPEVLKQCRLTSVKVFQNPASRNLNWRRDWRVLHWITQAHLSGIRQQRVVIFNKDGLVHRPVDGDGFNQLEYLNRFNVTKCDQILHRFLSEISKIVGDVDCPHTIFEFSVEGHSLIYNGKRTKTNSSLTEEFIQFANQM